MSSLKNVLVAASALALLGACSKQAEKTEGIRPVRAISLVSSDVDVNAEFSGEVKARVESRLGFRVGGKILFQQRVHAMGWRRDFQPTLVLHPTGGCSRTGRKTGNSATWPHPCVQLALFAIDITWHEANP